MTADSVLGIIEVKANAINQGLQKIVKKSNESGKFIFDAKTGKTKHIFNGVFSYDSTINDVDTIAKAIKIPWDETEQYPHREKFTVNHISLNQNWFYKFWEQKYTTQENPHFLYEIKELSFSFFISNLMNWISGTSVIENSNLWFPVDKSIQIRRTF